MPRSANCWTASGNAKRTSSCPRSGICTTPKPPSTITIIQLVGLGSSSDLFTAIHCAAEKLEKQAVKARTKWRDTKRTPRKASSEAESEPAAPEPTPEPEAERPSAVFITSTITEAQAMTLDEALLEMDGPRLLVYRDAETDRVMVLLRRRDGNFDLVEA